MSGWSFEPVGGWPVFVAAALALAPLLAIGPARARHRRRRRMTLAALRVATLAILLGLLARPAWETRTVRRLPGTLAIVADASRSMSVEDAGQGRSRYAALQRALNGSAAELAQLAQSWTIHGYAFGAELTPLEMSEGIFEFPAEPTESQTAIGATLDEVMKREAAERIAAVVLLSDGAQRAFAPYDEPPQTAARRLAADGVPLYTLALGQPSLGEQSDLRLSDLEAPDAVFAETPAVFSVVLSAAGYANRKATVRLLWESAEDGKLQPVDARQVTILPGKTRYPLKLSHAPRQAGEFKAAVVVEPAEGETGVANNQQSTFVSVLKGGVKVLYLAGAPRIGGAPGLEPRFVRQSLAANPDFHIQYEPITYARGEVDLRDRLRDEKYDVLLLGDVDATGLSMRSWREMAIEVEAGSGLAMLGGFHSFGPGGFLNTALDRALPTIIGPAERQSFGEPPRADMHLAPGPAGLKMQPVVRSGQVHPILQLGEGGDPLAKWRELPALDGANRLERVRLKPGALVVAEADDAVRSPLLVLSAYGEGRTAALAVDSTWHWVLEGFGEAHRRFWRQLVLWLAKKDETSDQRLWVRLDQRRYQQGSRVDFTFGAKDAAGEPVREAEFNLRIERPDGTIAAVRPHAAGAGSYSETTLPGDYRVVASARSGGESLGETAARFAISDQDIELDQPAAEPLLLRSLAELTADSGGAALAPEELPELWERLEARTKQFEEEVVETVTLWDRWPTLVGFVGLLSTEWYLRRRWGMA